MEWPTVLLTIIKDYYGKQRAQGGELTEPQKRDMTDALLEAYRTLSFEEKIDLLIPAKAEFIADSAVVAHGVADGVTYSIRYKWPTECEITDGFEGEATPKTLQTGEEYDRIGGETGRFMCPLENGVPQLYHRRAIPYYIPEEDISQSPAYHRYKIGATYSDSKCRYGRIAPAFWKDGQDFIDGGGTQVSLGCSISSIRAEGRGVFIDVD